MHDLLSLSDKGLIEALKDDAIYGYRCTQAIRNGYIPTMLVEEIRHSIRTIKERGNIGAIRLKPKLNQEVEKPINRHEIKPIIQSQTP